MIELPMHAFHPVAVHLPLVALPAAILCDWLDRRSGGERWRVPASLCWAVGLLGALAAVGSGLWAYDRVDHSGASHALMTLHRNVALTMLGVLGVAGLWRSIRRGALPPLLLGLAGLGLLGWTGYMGGELVYRHATGLPTTTMREVLQERGMRLIPVDSIAVPDSMMASDSMAAPAVPSHTHDDGSTHQH